MAGIDFESDLSLFRGLNSVKTKTRTRKSKISYTRVRELVKEAFADSIDVHLIGVHSLRAGDASSAANNGSLFLTCAMVIRKRKRWIH